MSKLLPVFYLPPVSWFAEFLAAGEVVLEQHENFPKQTYRNRANIYGANGKLSLIIPISHGGNRALKDTKVCNRENWQSLHWKSIKTAYQSSPYFEFYEDKFLKIFENGEKSLMNFNLKALQIILGILKTEKAYSLNQEYIAEPTELNFREKFSAKKLQKFDVAEYYQVFSDKFGFLPDLSIADLLFNLGPESLNYIKNLKKEF